MGMLEESVVGPSPNVCDGAVLDDNLLGNLGGITIGYSKFA